MRLKVLRCVSMVVLALSAAHFSGFCAAPSVVATASPSSGAAPLAVLFDGSGSAANGAVAYQWEFGDGGSSTSAQVAHIYNVAGTYSATLTVADAQGNTSNPATIIITVTGTGAGNVTPNMSYRIAPFTASFKINRKVLNSDSFSVRGSFNTVDLPPNLLNLAALITINDTFSIKGNLTTDNSFSNPVNSVKPSFFAFINVPDQQFNFQISKANLATALAKSGAVDATVTKSVPVKFSLTIGSQTYDFTQSFDYSAIQGVSAAGKYDLSKNLGDIDEGFFVVSKASAIEVPDTKSHFFEFDGYISRANSTLINLPVSGTTPPPTAMWRFTFNQADPVKLPMDNFILNKNLITYLQPDRALGGLHTLVIDVVKRTFVITTWDIKSNVNFGGSGLPVRGESFTNYNFILRFDIDQFDNPNNPTTLSMVTATKLSRKTSDDAFWQTGRKKPGTK